MSGKRGVGGTQRSAAVIPLEIPRDWAGPCEEMGSKPSSCTHHMGPCANLERLLALCIPHSFSSKIRMVIVPTS